MSWFGTNTEAQYLLGSLGFAEYNISEMEGTAKSIVDVIEIDDKNSKLPTGVHWLIIGLTLVNGL